MNIEEIREYCIKKAGVEEGFPFGESTLVFKVMGKMFLLLSLDENPPSFNVKCEPQKAIDLREKYTAIKPGYHMNKKHWNTVICDGSIPKKTLTESIDHSYDLVIRSLPNKARQLLLDQK